MERIVLFDGVCNYCNAMVNFTIQHDPEKKYKFATLQSDVGQKLLAEHGIGKDVDSVILIENGKAFMHSTAGLRIARNLSGIYSLSYVFIFIPAFIGWSHIVLISPKPACAYPRQKPWPAGCLCCQPGQR